MLTAQKLKQARKELWQIRLRFRILRNSWSQQTIGARYLEVRKKWLLADVEKCRRMLR